MPAKIIIFAGAPLPSGVTESNSVLTTHIPPFTTFLNHPSSSPKPSQLPSPLPKQPLAPWRSLPLTRQPLHTGLTQHHSYINDLSSQRHSGFFSTADVSLSQDITGSYDSEDVQEALTQFFEASLEALEGTSLLEDSFETSFMSEDGDTSRLSELQPQQPRQGVAAHLSDLEDIPPAKRIVALNPSTVTLNLIVGILSIAQPRSVTTRWGKAMSLIELLVGDDTRSGFAVTFWLPEAQVKDSPVSKLRRQEVVLLQNVALHVFRGKVYGQSLRRDMTKVSVLWSPSGPGLYSTRALSKSKPSDPQMHKTKLVKDWVLKFVGADPGARSKSKRKLRSWDEPPPDSQ